MLPQLPIGPRLVVEATSHRRHAKWVISLRLTEGDAYLDSGTISISSGYVSARRIWKSEKESFVNVCIHQHKKITSVDHQLGCYLPPTVVTTEKVRWAHR